MEAAVCVSEAKAEDDENEAELRNSEEHSRRCSEASGVLPHSEAGFGLSSAPHDAQPTL